MPETLAFLETGSALARVLLLEKKEVDCMVGLELLVVVDVIDDFRDRLLGALSFSFASAGFSVDLADRKPNAPREAIVAWLAAAWISVKDYELRTT